MPFCGRTVYRGPLTSLGELASGIHSWRKVLRLGDQVKVKSPLRFEDRTRACQVITCETRYFGNGNSRIECCVFSEVIEIGER